ncbi:amidohydrolase 2 [Thermaerobacter marianensis DSM 12885]|uniref:Amidohydrolase 2 n=1 Tax=Thermaerobacter marianensis (strain ATCC 700841 / DSM 12885 / JCM 10246 / 7p75a) TaxID=644966 RepID=E6SI08_THEM7|nr:amidohydrolase family protein [Thermaerobacter marianensis]ADU51888.1 amidohydrolase 2 [Thermaerobacter marianensis DSM 12885]
MFPLHDLHAHFIPPVVLTWLREHAAEVDARWERAGPAGAEFLTVGGRWTFELKPAFTDPGRFLEDQQSAGVSHILVSPVPQLFLYEAPAALTAELATLYNNALAAWARQNPARLSALATVPLNDPEAAAAELRRAVGLGLRGAIVGPGCGERLLTDDAFRPFWEEADRLEAIVFLHPLLSRDPRLRRPRMPNLIGVPWETTVAAADILLGGLLDRYPRVRVLLAHGGGFLPYQIGRLDSGYERWPAVAAALAAPPQEYLRRFWFDSVLWNPKALRFLVALVGEDRVVPGSDYPFDLSAWPPVAVGERGAEALLAPSRS